MSTTNTGDSIIVRCDACQKALRLPASAAGRRIRCPACKHGLAIPAGAARSSASARQRPPSTSSRRMTPNHDMAASSARLRSAYESVAKSNAGRNRHLKQEEARSTSRRNLRMLTWGTAGLLVLLVASGGYTIYHRVMWGDSLQERIREEGIAPLSQAPESFHPYYTGQIVEARFPVRTLWVNTGDDLQKPENTSLRGAAFAVAHRLPIYVDPRNRIINASGTRRIQDIQSKLQSSYSLEAVQAGDWPATLVASRTSNDIDRGELFLRGAVLDFGESLPSALEEIKKGKNLQNRVDAIARRHQELQAMQDSTRRQVQQTPDSSDAPPDSAPSSSATTTPATVMPAQEQYVMRVRGRLYMLPIPLRVLPRRDYLTTLAMPYRADRFSPDGDGVGTTFVPILVAETFALEHLKGTDKQ